MRKILFRGKTESGEWVFGSLADFGGGDCGIISGFSSSDYSFFNVIPETVGQYTGFTDRDGNMIFDGDNLIYHHEVTKLLFVDEIDKSKQVYYDDDTLMPMQYGKSGKVIRYRGLVEMDEFGLHMNLPGRFKWWKYLDENESLERIEIVGCIHEKPKQKKKRK